MVNEMERIGNLDPSRGATTAGNDRPAGGRDGPAAPPRSADAAGWRRDAAFFPSFVTPPSRFFNWT